MAIANTTGGLKVDPTYHPVPVSPPAQGAQAAAAQTHDLVVVRGTIDEDRIAELETHPDVAKVWLDPKIAPFSGARGSRRRSDPVRPRPSPAEGPGGPCPVPPCDCTFGNPANGTIASVATYLGVDQIWAAGQRGAGIVIGIVDGGITAIGRTPKQGEVARVPHVVDGSLPDWGTTAVAWGDHGNMTSTDALGMAPDAHIYDIRISDAAAGSDPTVSNALAGFQWAINRHASDGTPHVLSNSWGIFQKSWDPTYATDANHPFTRKVVEAINDGILVLFASGNCGAACPDGRCGADTGPGSDIWGANGHPSVMTVGAVNLSEQLVGYSSVGPAALDPHKPDFCSITHFAGYFPTIEPGEPSDTGTSAATPIAAGVVALLKQHQPSLTQDAAKNALRNTAKDIGPPGWDQYTGAGIIRAKAAWDSLSPKLKLIDDGGTVKVADDITVKVQDDITVKVQDDITVKIHDDITVKTHDDITLKTHDDITLKTHDDITLKTHDDITLKTHDDITLKTHDDITIKLVDDGGTIKIADDGIPGGNPPGGDPGRGATQASSAPFILSTPHHSMAWAAGGSSQEPPPSGGAASAQSDPQTQEQEAELAGLEQRIRERLQELHQLDAQYRTLLTNYQARRRQ
jgi:hypothetical protein